MMVRRLFNIATMLALLLSLASAAMWARSQFVTEGWEFRPRPKANAYAGVGWHTYRLVESAGGRLVYADYDWRNDLDIDIPSVSLPVAGYRESTVPLTHELRGRVPNNDWRGRSTPGIVHGRLPGVAEWCSIPSGYRRRFIAVSWLAVAVAFAALPGARAWWRWWRRRRSTRPAFPVITSDPTNDQPRPTITSSGTT